MGRFTNPRDLYFGEGARHEVKNLKGKKAIIVSGGSSMRRGGFLQDVEADLKEAGMEVKLFEGVESDPSIETVMKGAAAMRDFEPTGSLLSAAVRPSMLLRPCGSSTSIPRSPSTTLSSRSASPSCVRRLTSAPFPLPPAPLRK